MDLKTQTNAEPEKHTCDYLLPAVTMEIYTDFESCRELVPEWDDFVERVSGDIFQSFDWCRIWWKYYGENRALRIYLFRIDTRIVGLIPMFLETIRLGPVSIRRAKMVGSDFFGGQFRPAVEAECLGLVMRALIIEHGTLDCDQVVLGPLAGRYALFPELLECLREVCGETFSLQVKEDPVQVYYRLADNYEQWLGQFNSSQRNVMRREERRLEKQSLSFTFEMADETTWEAMFDDFVQLHQEYWNARGGSGHFGGSPRTRSFHGEMAQTQLELGRLRLFRVRCENGSRAYVFNYRFGDAYFSMLVARTLEAPQGVSLGRLLHCRMVRHAIGESVRWVDAMRGDFGYKCSQGGEIFPLRLIRVNRNDRWGRIRIRAFNLAARLLHLFYYQIYYYRLASKLPLARRRGPWSLWSRACCL